MAPKPVRLCVRLPTELVEALDQVRADMPEGERTMSAVTRKLLTEGLRALATRQSPQPDHYLVRNRLFHLTPR